MTKVNNTSLNKRQKTYHIPHERWLASDELTITKLMSLKKQSRFKKGELWNGFVLVRQKENDEFSDFLTLLHTNIQQIPANTRISLAIRTLFYDPAMDTQPDLLSSTIKSPKHWTAVDLLVDETRNVHSFVLDGANSVGYRGIHQLLKAFFPPGKHYIFEEDVYTGENGVSKTRVIQTRWRGCHVFALHHLNVLSKINTNTLYHMELPRLAAHNCQKNGIIQPGDFSGELELAKIFMPTQSLSTIESLSIKNARVTKKGKTMSLLEAVNASSTRVETVNGPITINQANYHKNLRYIEKESLFYAFSRHKIATIMKSKNGFVYLQNRSLFNLNAALKQVSHLDIMIPTIVNLHDLLDESKAHFPVKIHSHIGNLLCLFSQPSLLLEDIKYNLMLLMENALMNISSKECRLKFNRLIELSLFISFEQCRIGIINLNKTHLYAHYGILDAFKNTLTTDCWLDDAINLIVGLRDKLSLLNNKAVNLLCANELDLVCLLLSQQQVSREEAAQRCLFLMETQFFCAYMKNDEAFASCLTQIIQTVLPNALPTITKPRL